MRGGAWRGMGCWEDGSGGSLQKIWTAGSNKKFEGSICEKKTKERRGSIYCDGSDGQRCATFFRGHMSRRGKLGAPMPPSPWCIVYTRWTARYAAPARIEDEELRPARPRRAGAPPPRRPAPRPPRFHPASAAPPPRRPAARSPRPAPRVRLHPTARLWREVAAVGGGAVRRTEEGGGR